MSNQSVSKNVPRAVQACHELLAWLIPLLDKFPRSRRFTLGERLEAGLQRANPQLEVQRNLWRLADKLGVILPKVPLLSPRTPIE